MDEDFWEVVVYNGGGCEVVATNFDELDVKYVVINYNEPGQIDKYNPNLDNYDLSSYSSELWFEVN